MSQPKPIRPLGLLLLLFACSQHPDVAVPPPTGDPGVETLGDAPMILDTYANEQESAAKLVADALARTAAAEAAETATLANAPAWLAFYDPDTIHEVRVTLTPEARDSLYSDARAWVPAAVEVDGQPFPNAGVHIKGNTTFQGLSEKPSLKIKLDEYGHNERIAGVKRLTLNNMVSDPAQAREVLALRLWWELGVPAPRASWAQVWIDDELYGLYSNLESMDENWVRRRYRNAGGDLWEANDGADFTADGLVAWERAAGVGNRAMLDTLAAALDDGSDAPLEERIGGLVDLDAFRTYWAACLVTGATDGYPFHLNDAFAYADPGDGERLDLFPWSMDEAWGDKFGTYAEGELANACADDADCSAALDARISEMIHALEALDVAGAVDDTFSVSKAALDADPRRPYASLDVQAGRDALRARVLGWPATLRSTLHMTNP